MTAITLGGRTGTVSYVDEQWRPVNPAQAAMARVCFEDGSTSFYRVQVPIAAKFDEALHPRDQKGKFTDGSTEATTAQSDTGRGSAGGVGVSTSPGRPTAAATATDIAQAYNAEHGLPPIAHDYVTVDEVKAGDIADAYDALPVDFHNNPAVQRAYAALSAEIEAQWDFITARGVTFEPWAQEGQPYHSSQEMIDDVRDHQHLYFFTGGEPHPLLDVKDPKTGLSMNEKLRAVHDYFGHAAGGYGFGARGEENAWMAHSQMFSDEARRALTTETRGQNSWVNFGAQNYEADGTPKHIPPADRPYATQKVALLPDRFVFDRTPSRKFDAAKHPRDADGQFTIVGMTSNRPGSQAKDVFKHMEAFRNQLQALPHVSHVSVQPGVGAWQGGSEPTWVVSYQGNGAATKLLAETGQHYNQDAVLVVRNHATPETVPSQATEWTFPHGLGPTQREAIGRLLVEQGFGGWTWFKSGGHQILRVVAVPQWGGSVESHATAVTKVTDLLTQGGHEPGVQTSAVNVAIMERTGEHSYDHVLAKQAQDGMPVVSARVNVAGPAPVSPSAVVRPARVVTYADDGRSAVVTMVTPEGKTVGPVRHVEFTETGQIKRVTETFPEA